MNLKEKLEALAQEKNTPCVTISLNTHRTFPENKKDEILLKNFLKEAEDRVINEFGKRPSEQLLQNIHSVMNEIDINYHLDSLHLFLSNNTKEIVKSSWSSSYQGVQVSDSFAIRPLIKSFNRSESYLVMLLSQGGVQLFEAINEEIIREINNEDFPFTENQHYNTHSDKGSDAKHLDDLVREFLNKVDKALLRVHHENDLKCVIIATEDNFSRLQQVADKPTIYIGHASIDYNNVSTHHIVKQAWELVQKEQKENRALAIEEMLEAVSSGKVVTDLQEIYQAAIDGRADLLIMHQDFSQAVMMQSDRTFELIDDTKTPNAIDDISSAIAWEVLSKKGRVVFTTQEEFKSFGNIALKTRY